MKKSLFQIFRGKTQTIAICAILGHSAFGIQNSFAQFDKYKAKTNFDSDSESAPAEDQAYETLDDAPMEEDSNSNASVRPILDKNAKTDSFGRDTDISSMKLPDRDRKYVNLNPETAFGPEVVTSFDFPDVSLVELTKHMQKLTGINLIMEKDIKGKVSITAPSPITVGDAWKAYLTGLNMNGYTLVKSGAFYKIVNSRDIRYTPTKIYTGTYTPDTENYVMKIIPLKNIDSTEVTRSFRPFMSRYGRIIEIKQTNTIIVQDTGDNINRLGRLIKFIDVPGHDETLHIIPVKNTSAQEIAKLLDQILKGNTGSKFKGAPAPGSGQKDQNISKIIAEPRTNSIIAMANADGFKQLRNLIGKLDVKLVNQGSGQIHVYYLNHGDAESLAKTLTGLVSGAGPKKGITPTFNAKSGGGSESLFNDDVKINADKDNNALVVTASPTDWLTVKSVIDKLDIARDQVYVEGMIMETQVNKGKGGGITLVGAYGTGAAKAGFVGGNGGQDLLAVLTNNITSLGGLFIGGGTGKKVNMSVGGQNVQVNSVNGLITAIANNSSTNVLATPQILALDNTEATFEVGESVPVSEQTIANNQTQISVKQQKAGLTLKLTPQINKVTRFVKLKIDQKIEEFQARANSSAAGGVATTSRAAVTTVVVRDRDTIAMGGLMRDQLIETESKVPLLGDIPVLGWLFKNYNKTESKVNLLFFMTPKIMDSYQKTVAKTLKDNLNRRASHLKDVVADGDYFGSTVRDIYDQAKKQEEGPLYDPKDSAHFNKNNINNSEDFGPAKEIPTEEDKQEAKEGTQDDVIETIDANDDLLSDVPDAPAASEDVLHVDYKGIQQVINSKNAGIQKEEKQP